MPHEMMLFKLDRSAATPVYRQIVDQLRNLIETGILKVGTRLPPTRAAAAHLGVDRTTVFRAYQELLALGYIESRPGSYTTVREKPGITLMEQGRETGALIWERLSNPASQTVFDIFKGYAPELDTFSHPGVINLTTLQVDPRTFPLRDLRRCTNEALASKGAALLEYGPATGYPPLRTYIAHRLRLHGIAATPNEILITNGSHHALDLIIRLLTVPGSTIAVESPTYAALIPLLRYYQLNVAHIPFHRGALDLNRLENLMAEGKLALVYTIPNFQNPTGMTSPQSHREQLLRLCQRFGVPLVEDGFEEEMKYSGNVAMPIKSMDKNHVVLYVGTFSKVLFPGLRIGWITAEEECILRLTSLKRFSDLTSSVFTQAILESFCRQGYYDRHLKKLHRLFRKRMHTALQAMKIYLSGLATWTEPEGGYIVWVSLLKPYASERLFKESLLRHDVLVSPGHYYFAGPRSNKHFRLSIAGVDEKEIVEGIRRLARALSTSR